MESKSFIRQVAHRIKNFRKRSELRQVELAEAVHLSGRHFQKIENGEIDLKISTANSLARSLKIPTCYLFQNNVYAGAGLSQDLPCPVEILDLLHVGVQINDPSGRITYMNKAHLNSLGISREEYLKGSLHIWDFLHNPDEAQPLKEYLKHLVQDQPMPTPFFAKNRTQNGEILPVKVEWRYLHNPDRTVRGFLSVVHYHPSW